MLSITDCPNTDRLLLRLTPEEKANPKEVFWELCNDYDIGEIREKLWEVFETVLSESDIYNDPAERRQLFHLFKLIERSIEAMYVLLLAENHHAVKKDTV